MLRSLILAAAGNHTLRTVLASVPGSRGVVRRFVAGDTTDDAVTTLSLIHISEPTRPY